MARDLCWGMSGPDVEALQKALWHLGYTQVGTADGQFESKTDAAVREFQGKFEIKVDGIVGDETRKKLDSAGVQRDLWELINQDHIIPT